ncbi:GNAT family N-acetyltransferase [Roseococcus pinisoli]|uniref:GNAT family N-acetyltransferase n=1 Tax=Roseococcus pinisoli TaxID=2835040 RepID=A0ABS5QC78_9PROT|nr:GNAT family N-acetyltransferase [Roseococcus pinisoli]MBS7811134.1 GNAT family N-acetyltransferase [Roseococcus pinisoli]
MSLVPELRTARLRLRGFVEADLDPFAAMQAEPGFMRHLGVGPSAGRPRTRAETWATMAGQLGQWALRGSGFWAIEHEGRFIGRAGILNPEGWPMPELAYGIAPAEWGRGFALEAASAALGWARENLPAPPVSFIHPDNHPSQRLAERLGAAQDGMIDLPGVQVQLWRYPPA